MLLTIIRRGLFFTLLLAAMLAQSSSAGQSSVGLSVHRGQLYPSFDLGRYYYVARCRPGATAIFGGNVEPLPRSGRIARLGNYRIRCLPADFPRWHFTQIRPTPSGMFVVSIPNPRPWIIIFDSAGAPVWWMRTPTNAENAQVSAAGIVSWERAFGDSYARDPRAAVEEAALTGRHLRTLRLPNGELIDGHEFRRLSNGDSLVISYVPQTDSQLGQLLGQGPVAAVWPTVFEITPTGHVVWSWDARGHIGLGEIEPIWWQAMIANPMPSSLSPVTYDPLHLNSVEPYQPRADQPEIIISSRRTDAIYGVSRTSGQVVWKLGGSRTANSLRVIADPYLDRGDQLLGGQHDVRVQGNVLSVYDDRSRLGQPPRAVFYRLDPGKGTATFLHQLTDPTISSSSWGGSVRPFGTGYLVDWGGTNRVTIFNDQGQITARYRLPGVSYRANPVPSNISLARLSR